MRRLRDKLFFHTFRNSDAMLTIHSHRFKIISADLYVYRYMKDNPELFSQDAIAGVRQFLLRNGHLKEDVRYRMESNRIDK